MTPSDQYAVWIGGSLALAGTALGLLASFANAWLDRRASRHRLMREKYEQLADYSVLSSTWYSSLSKCRTMEQLAEALPPTEIQKMAMLSLLYFPKLTASVSAYQDEAISFHHWAVDCFQLSRLSLGDQIAKHPDGASRSEALARARQKVNSEIQKYASRYSKA